MDVSILPHVSQEGLSLELALPLSSAHPLGSAAFSAAALVVLASWECSLHHAPPASILNRCLSVPAEPPPPLSLPSVLQCCAKCEVIKTENSPA